MVIGRFNPLKGERLQILDESGRVLDKSLEPSLTDKDLLTMYRFMVLARVADEKAFHLQREGRMGTYAPLKGQEAAQVGSAYALNTSDWAFPIYRDMAVMLIKGMPLDNIFLLWMGQELGNKVPEGVNLFPITIPVGSQIPIAVGVSWAAKIKGDRIAVLVSFGDGATSEGDFHEGMNFAGVFNTPTVFFCENNQYAISLPRERQTASKTIAQKSIAYGFGGIQVDGNDVLAVYAATKEALEKARSGNGPTLIEAFTYRISDHTTADDSTRYRSDDEVKAWLEKDPIKRFKLYLESKNILNPTLDDEIHREAKGEVDKAVELAEKVPPPTPEDIFKYNYAEMPWNLEEGLKGLKGYLEEKG
ncbi:MAG: pyruvate dehydrogenase (acetyl-transferring) E1 component subunit alpha [Deltaproteobacteria bacterium]|nr:pyruvate dehydrogenase (acetyl-transferring) E1 component subunit alpha [Deltaproteobacteria bacterium]